MAEDQNGGAQTPPETDATQLQSLERVVDKVSEGVGAALNLTAGIIIAADALEGKGVAAATGAKGYLLNRGGYLDGVAAVVDIAVAGEHIKTGEYAQAADKLARGGFELAGATIGGSIGALGGPAALVTVPAGAFLGKVLGGLAYDGYKDGWDVLSDALKRGDQAAARNAYKSLFQDISDGDLTSLPEYQKQLDRLREFAKKLDKQRNGEEPGLTDADRELMKELVDAKRQFGDPKIQDFIDRILDAADAARGLSSPLVLDLDGDGLDLIALANSDVIFEIDGDAFAEHTGWVLPDDGLLAIDLDGNGMIDGVSELFGSTTDSGFLKLALYDDNGDGVIDPSDAVFNDLRVWVDAGSDGVSAPDELLRLETLGIVAIDAVATSTRQWIEGNFVSDLASYELADGSSRLIADVWFATNQSASRYVGDVEIDPETFLLPDIRGAGQLPDLQIAMSLDPGLKAMVKAMVTKPMSEFDSLTEQVRAIVFRWAGAEDIDPQSRGGNFDARALHVFEQLSDAPWNGGANPLPGQSRGLTQAFEDYIDGVTARIALQAYSGDWLTGSFYDYRTDSPVLFTDAETAVAGLAPDSPDHALDFFTYWNGAWSILSRVAAESGADVTGLKADFVAGVVAEQSDNPLLRAIAARVADSTIERGETDDSIGLDADTKVALAGDGADRVYGGSGDDLIVGGGGADLLSGGQGSDAYLWGQGDGNDTIYEWGGSGYVDDRDSLLLTGLRLEDVTLSRYYDNLLVTIDATGETVTVGSQFAGNGSGIEKIVFADGTVLDRDAIASEAWYRGGSGDDQLYGSADDETFDGGGGDDMVYGGQGSDAYLWAAGHGSDWIVEYGYGADTDSLLLASLETADVTLGRSGSDLLVTIDATGETVTVSSQFSDNGSGIEEISFADGTVLDRDAIASEAWYRGGSGDDQLYGSADDETFLGGTGNDRFYGGQGDDSFVFDGALGIDEVLDFGTGNDVVDLSGLAGVDDFATVQAAMGSSGGNTVIDFGQGAAMILVGVDPLQLTEHDFIFAE